MLSGKYLLLIMVIFLVQVGLVACGDQTATPSVAGTVSQTASPATRPVTAIVPTSASASSPAPSPTTAVKTPLIASGLKKGTLKEVFPILAGLANDAKTIKIKNSLGNMALDYEDDYKLNRVGQDFKGLGLYETLFYFPNGLIFENALEINVPAKDAQAFFEKLEQVPVEEGKGPPIPLATDNYPFLAFDVVTQYGALHFESNSQKDDFFPWTVSFNGRIFTATDSSPFQAYTFIKSYLQTPSEKERFEIAHPFITTQRPPNPLPPPPLNPLKQIRQGVFDTGDVKRFGELTFNPTTQLWASPAQISQIQLFDTNGQSSKILDAKESLLILAFSPDGKYLATGVSEKFLGRKGETAVEVWEVASGRQIAHLTGHERGVSALAFSGDGHTLVSASPDRTVRVWSLPDGKNTAVLQDKLPDVYSFLSVAISQDGKRVAAAGRGDVVSGYFPIKVWELGKNSVETTLKGHSYYITTLDFSPDGRTLVSADEKGDLKLWDSQTWQVRASWSNSPALLVNSLAISPDSRTLATTHHAGDLRLWDMTTLKPLSVTIAATPEKPGYWTSVRAFFSADGKSILTGDLENATFSQWAVNP